MSKERPVLFSAPMIRAILEGRKTVTRRIVKPQPYLADNGEHWIWDGKKCAAMWAVTETPNLSDCCPHGQAGDRLWVRETFAHIWTDKERDWHCVYVADGIPEYLPKGEVIKWTPSIHMPRAYSRLTLEVVSVRVERLQQISAKDAKAEGCEYRIQCGNGMTTQEHDGTGWIDGYRQLWETLHGPGSWELSPWVWVIEFRRIEQP